MLPPMLLDVAVVYRLAFFLFYIPVSYLILSQLFHWKVPCLSGDMSLVSLLWISHVLISVLTNPSYFIPILNFKSTWAIMTKLKSSSILRGAARPNIAPHPPRKHGAEAATEYPAALVPTIIAWTSSTPAIVSTGGRLWRRKMIGPPRAQAAAGQLGGQPTTAHLKPLPARLPGAGTLRFYLSEIERFENLKFRVKMPQTVSIVMYLSILHSLWIDWVILWRIKYFQGLSKHVFTFFCLIKLANRFYINTCHGQDILVLETTEQAWWNKWKGTNVSLPQGYRYNTNKS